jgi:hypothetical protein
MSASTPRIAVARLAAERFKHSVQLGLAALLEPLHVGQLLRY